MIISNEQGEQIREFVKSLVGEEVEILVALANDEEILVTSRTLCVVCMMESIIQALSDEGRYNHKVAGEMIESEIPKTRIN